MIDGGQLKKERKGKRERRVEENKKKNEKKVEEKKAVAKTADSKGTKKL